MIVQRAPTSPARRSGNPILEQIARDLQL